MEPSEILLRQLSRVYGELLDVAYAPTAVARDPQRLAQSLFDEAASSDDVTSRESAIAYLSARLEAFGDYIPNDLRPLIRQRFIDCWDAWERVE